MYPGIYTDPDPLKLELAELLKISISSTMAVAPSLFILEIRGFAVFAARLEQITTGVCLTEKIIYWLQTSFNTICVLVTGLTDNEQN